jgi:hypothetical protein
MSIINTYFKKFYPKELKQEYLEFIPNLGGMWQYTEPGISNIFPVVKCNDGFEISVQGHCGAYSTPRDDFSDFYAEVEVGYPNQKEELLYQYMKKRNRDYWDEQEKYDIFPYVPVNLIDEIITKHGGLKEENNNEK